MYIYIYTYVKLSCCFLFSFIPQPGLPWGSYSPERISVGVVREGGSPGYAGPVPQRAWYQDPGTNREPKINVPKLIYLNFQISRK